MKKYFRALFPDHHTLKLIQEILFFNHAYYTVISAFLLLLLGRGMLLFSLYFYQFILDALSFSKHSLAVPVGIVVVYAAARVTSEGGVLLSTILFAFLSQGAMQKYSLKVFEHLQKLSANFYAHSKSGETARSFVKGIGGIEFIYQTMIAYLLPSLIEFFVVLVYLSFVFPGEIFSVMVLLLMVYLFLNFLTIKMQAHYHHKINRLDLNTHHLVFESMLHHETIKAFTCEQWMMDQYRLDLQQQDRYKMKSQVNGALLGTLKNLMIIGFSVYSL